MLILLSSKIKDVLNTHTQNTHTVFWLLCVCLDYETVETTRIFLDIDHFLWHFFHLQGFLG